MNWEKGPAIAAALPGNQSTGGPGDIDDNYLSSLSHGSGGSGARQVMFNQSQWAGDYNAAGISAISMDLQSFSDTPFWHKYRKAYCHSSCCGK